MGVISSIVVLCLWAYRLIIKRKNDYLTFYWLIWGIVLLFSGLHLYGMYSFSSDNYLIIIVAIFFFSVAFFAGRYGVIHRKKNTQLSLVNRKKVYKFNNIILYLFTVITTLFVIYTLVRTIALLRLGLPMGTIHAMYLNRGASEFYTNTLMREIRSKLVVPIIYACIPVAIYLIVIDRFKKKLLTMVFIMDTILWSIATGGRFILIQYLVDIILIFPFANLKFNKKQIRKIRKIVCYIAFILIAIIAIYTAYRKNFDSDQNVFADLFEESYKYLALCVPLSDHWFNTVNSERIITYGTMSLYGILGNIEWVFVRIFHLKSFSILKLPTDVLNNIESMVPLFKDASGNAFVTYNFYFYTDFRLLGVIIGNLLLGILAGLIERKAYKERSSRSILLYLLFSQTILKTFVRLEVANTAYIISFIILALILKKERSGEQYSITEL